LNLKRVPVGMIPAGWPVWSRQLAKAIETDPERDADDVLAELLSGELQLWRVVGEASGLVVTMFAPVAATGVPAAWLLYAAGEATGGPRDRIQHYRDVVALFEQVAADGHASELWVEARDEWGRALLDIGFEVVAERPGHASFRKVLHAA
jgi:hypothetical protein